MKVKRFAIVGAGMSGVLTAIRLKERGIEAFTIYEKASRLGGAWRDNTYPGLSADVPSHAYSYSFELKPDWSRHFASGAEILAYFTWVARKYDVYKHILFDSEVERIEYDSGKWRVRTRAGLVDTVDFVICATGHLHHPIYPKIPGLDSFAGRQFHSARWDHSARISGNRIGIIGTGSTAVQIVPAIVSCAGSICLFQRTAQWIRPKPNPAYSEAQQELYRHFPEKLRESYCHWSRRFFDTFARTTLNDQNELQKIADDCTANLELNVQDIDLRRKLTPNYPVSWKRLIMSDDFYPALQKPNVQLVAEGIECIEPKGVRSKSGALHELDVLVMATGFDTQAFMRPMEVVGVHDWTLAKAWSRSSEAYRSVSVPGFPNFFMLVGPNSPIANLSVIAIAELQVEYILQLVDLVRSGRYRAVVPKADASVRFNSELKEAIKSIAWSANGKSWYRGKDGTPVLWPWSFERFRADMHRPDLRDFDLIV